MDNYSLNPFITNPFMTQPAHLPPLPATKNDHSKSSFDGFPYHKMISQSGPISRKLKNSFNSFKV